MTQVIDMPFPLQKGKYETRRHITTFEEVKVGDIDMSVCSSCGYDRCEVAYSSYASRGNVTCNNPECDWWTPIGDK